jgi:hypothetical protein
MPTAWSNGEYYREIAGGVLLMYGGKSDSKAVVARQVLATARTLRETTHTARNFSTLQTRCLYGCRTPGPHDRS